LVPPFGGDSFRLPAKLGTTFVAVLVIPVTVLATFLAMYLAGLSFDLMTLAAWRRPLDW